MVFFDDYPKLENAKLSNNVDSFGNLCLISRSRNSKLSNYLPNEKKSHYLPGKNNAVESLKQQLMLCYDGWDNDNVDNIIEHEEEMKELLLEKYCG